MRLISQHFENRKTQALALLVCAWVVAVLTGGFLQIQYSMSSGRSGEVTRQWPTSTNILKHRDSKQLLIFLHPKCACSVASLMELAKFQDRTQQIVPIQAIFFCPDEEDESWVNEKLWTIAESIEGCERFVDFGAIEAQRFGIETSGHVLLFNGLGLRMFSGGVTSSRGHVGDNLGVRTLTSLIDGEAVVTTELPVFGCKILSDGGRVNE